MGILDIFKKKVSSSSNAQNNINPFGGGDGSSIENAVIINAQSTLNGIMYEHLYISKIHGEKDTKWKLIQQQLLEVGGRHYDAMRISIINNEIIVYYFDISNFYGKMI